MEQVKQKYYIGNGHSISSVEETWCQGYSALKIIVERHKEEREHTQRKIQSMVQIFNASRAIGVRHKTRKG